MSKYNDKGESQAIRGLAKYTDEIRDRFINLAISYNTVSYTHLLSEKKNVFLIS